MTLVLELSPEVEAQIAQEAAARGVSVEVFALEAIDRTIQRTGRLNRLQGLCAGSTRTVDDFLAERHAEGEADYDKGQQREAA